VALEKPARKGLLERLAQRVRQALARPPRLVEMIEPERPALEAWRALLGLRATDRK
jgi:hypothetical protein